MGAGNDTLNDTTHSSAGNGSKKKEQAKPMATYGETFSFVFDCGPGVAWLFVFGTIGAIANGMVFPILAYLFADSFSSISASASEGLAEVRELAYTFMIVGAYALVAGFVQHYCFEAVAYFASHRFRREWFKALLRQDPAFFDVNEVAGIAAQVGPNANKYRRGLGRKLGEGIQFFTTGVGGIGYAFWASWQVAFVVLAVLPFVAAAGASVMSINQTKGARASRCYKRAGGVAYSSVSAIKTVLSLNAVEEMISQYMDATEEAYRSSVAVLPRHGLANGAMLAFFLMLYAVLTLFGTFLLYRDIEDTGCDPSDGVSGNFTCDNAGPDVFGSMLGVAFAGQGISQCSNVISFISAARVAVYEALQAIGRVPGSPEQIIYRTKDDDLNTTTHSRSNKGSEKNAQLEGSKEAEVKAILPKYEIDSSAKDGLKPEHVQGAISIKDVFFTYPTRPNNPVLKGYSVEIEAGQTVAFVGPSGGGKSTVVSLIERFYDPQSGTIELDGINIKDINVAHLRSLIGYVGQEPTLFATSIRGNITYGNPNATQEQVERAARLANAHDFIVNFSDGYDTQVGDKGSQLSGGQKQRIAIARVLVSNPQILLLDEATSALDAESELVVQKALDNILHERKITTIIIAHRLSTIRNADKINVIVDGQVKESGTHEELMEKESYYFGLVQKQEGSVKEDVTTTHETSHDGTDHAVYDAKQIVMSSDKGGDPLIEFKNVTFAYPSRPKKIIFDGLDLMIRAGETVALVGPSGGGKSTTVGLIERFYDPMDGSIEFRGHDLRSLNVYWYREQIGYVGQEPTLFNDSIARNIAYGLPGASQAAIEEAAKAANAHDFISDFPEGYETMVGERGTQLSGGQKQRVAIARALVKKPALLILDEATSALDNESESIVQEAIDKLMQLKQQTVVVIAHRLSTIRNADKIAFIANGKVVEFGSHEELMTLHKGRYRRFVESSKRGSTLDSVGIGKEDSKDKGNENKVEEVDWEELFEEEEKKAFDSKRARQLASPDAPFMLIGTIGSIMSGSVFPVWGILFSELIDLLFRRVERCDENNIPLELQEFEESWADVADEKCQEFWINIADEMREDSFRVAIYWAVVMTGCVVGQVLMFWGFGIASERLNKRLRDSSFMALLRQEVAFFDKRSVGSITSQLQDDAARIHAFSGEPIRSFFVAMSAVFTGVVLGFVFMWQFALLALASIPIMAFATSLEMKQFLGEDEGSDEETAEGRNTPGGVLVETLLNIRTVAALTLEDQRFADYERALIETEPFSRTGFVSSGVTGGISQFIQQWVNGLQLWFGGWVLYNIDGYSFKDFLIADFAILFGLFGLGAAFQDISDKKEVEKSAGRVFYLLDRKSQIDPLSVEGKKLS